MDTAVLYKYKKKIKQQFSTGIRTNVNYDSSATFAKISCFIFAYVLTCCFDCVVVGQIIMCYDVRYIHFAFIYIYQYRLHACTIERTVADKQSSVQVQVIKTKCKK